MKDYNWRDQRPTPDQVRAITGIQARLGYTLSVPATKGECSDLIDKLKKEQIKILKRIY